MFMGKKGKWDVLPVKLPESELVLIMHETALRKRLLWLSAPCPTRMAAVNKTALIASAGDRRELQCNLH